MSLSARFTGHPATDLLEALADPVRLSILILLAEKPMLSGAQIMRELMIQPPMLTRNLRRLQVAGLISKHRNPPGFLYATTDQVTWSAGMLTAESQGTQVTVTTGVRP